MHETKRFLGVTAVGLLALGIIGGCEKQVREAKQPAPAETTAGNTSTTQPAGEATVAAAAVGENSKTSQTQPALNFLMIDGLGAEFPPTRLMLYPSEPGKSETRAELFSDLPKSALRKYDGNELYLDMKLQGAGADKKLDAASWWFKSDRSGKVNSPNGIFLNGQATHLQPFDVAVRFERRDDQLYAQIAGRFRSYEDGAPEALAPFVDVRGELPVEIVQKQ